MIPNNRSVLFAVRRRRFFFFQGPRTRPPLRMARPALMSNSHVLLTLIGPTCAPFVTSNNTRRFFGKKKKGNKPNNNSDPEQRRSKKETMMNYSPQKEKDEIAAQLEAVEAQLRQAEKETFGKYRGRNTIQKLLRQAATSNNKRRRVNSHVAMTHLRTLLYQRHALKHGGVTKLKQLKPKQLGQSFLGPDTNQKISTQDARLILIELWRYRTSGHYDKSKKAHDLYLERRKKAEQQSSNEKQKEEKEKETNDNDGESSTVVQE